MREWRANFSAHERPERQKLFCPSARRIRGEETNMKRVTREIRTETEKGLNVIVLTEEVGRTGSAIWSDGIFFASSP